MLIINHVMGESAQEKQKCAEQLTNVATCLPYLGGSAKAPTSDCCSGLIQAIKNNKKCICIIVKDRDDPDLGLKINITLALGLPSLCKASNNLSQCPCEFHQSYFLFQSFKFHHASFSIQWSTTCPVLKLSMFLFDTFITCFEIVIVFYR
jgi:hypothetical protein